MTAEPIVLTADLFDAHVGQAFQVSGRHVLALNEVERGARQAWHEQLGFTPFTLLFSGPPGDVLAEGMHVIALPDGPAYEMYLMPIHTPAPGRQDYQAVFN